MHKARSTKQEFRLGLIKATVSVRSSKGKVRYTVSTNRLYRNGDQWKESTKFGPEDIPVLRLVLDRAYGWILLKQQESVDQASESVKA